MESHVEKKAIELFCAGSSEESIAVILSAEVEEIEKITSDYLKKNIEGPSKEKGKTARNKVIRQEYEDGKTAKYLSDKHNLHVSSIYIICKGIKKKPKTPPSTTPSPLRRKPSPVVLVPPVKIEHYLHQFEPRYTERRLFFGTLKVYVGDICVQCGKAGQLKTK